ncbi:MULTISPECIES: SDR family NAD(P)-dependent oxidoreductase [unclassified Rhizobium]|jgi:short-subunit dehydrogenase|uniref:SDR family NAD(P)-dependent oxidoreductase n=1 Tax=unclassified Rhizobium TaxID=2613769 RepID=UPI000646DAB3|nr:MULTISPECIES: SDR family NAD(P)-dependent oxidoreductase [unclassified Rhizobium]MBN8953218.1 SDR family NAD(P)-dependent oxidoreductase [Rhizobium tropici]OJY75668.1 MAG: short-chain dehydrogenase [Rhizobium sp. 60-20]RKD75123.1 short-subunit dehydrogenase [Rhizobium sp. WW_1]
MTDRKTIAIFGAGTGLGASLATRFGREGYRVALVARNAASLGERVADLDRAGIEAAAFSADLGNLDGIAALVHSIEERFGSIDVSVYAPVPSDVGFTPAAELDAAKLLSAITLFSLSPVEVSHAVLPGMLKRGGGSLVIVSGLSAVVPMAGFAGIGPAMAAARNYALTLHAELRSDGIYSGSVSIGALIERSAGKRTMEASGVKLDGAFPILDPDDIAQEIWTLVAERDRAEAILPPLPAA